MPSDCMHSSLTINSMVPLGDWGERRIRSSDAPLLPHGTNDSIATTSAVPSPPAPLFRTASTSRQSPSAGSPRRPRAIEKPRSSSVSRHASARLTTWAISSVPMSRCLRIRTPAPARRARVTAWRTARMSGPGQPEIVGMQDRLVAELQRVEARRAERLRARRTGAHHAGCPPVVLAQSQPGLDGLWPGLRIADRIAAGQAHPDLDAVGDRGAAVRSEHHGLVAAGGEVAQRVVLAVELEQTTDGRFVLAGERVLGALRLEQHDRGEPSSASAPNRPSSALTNTCG